MSNLTNLQRGRETDASALVAMLTTRTVSEDQMGDEVLADVAGVVVKSQNASREWRVWRMV